jgi:signal transduction histidine kinase
MTSLEREFEERFAATLRAHLVGPSESTLHAAYELGRDALGRGLGVLDVTSMLHAALRHLASSAKLGEAREIVRRVEPFLLECFSPFEMAHRASREANAALRRLDEVREREIHRLARELHDEAGQMLVAAHLSLRHVAAEMGPQASAALEPVHDQLREAEAQLRRIAHEMRPSMLDDIGLLPALNFLVKGFASRHDLQMRVEGSLPGRLTHEMEIALYRIAQEALNNVARHAKAKAVTVKLDHHPERLQLSVRDDGCGFEPQLFSTRGGRGGLGLRGIRERLEPFGGFFAIRSEPGRGTELTVELPLKWEEHATSLVG